MNNLVRRVFCRSLKTKHVQVTLREDGRYHVRVTKKTYRPNVLYGKVDARYDRAR